MKQVIDGKLYNTDTAESIHAWSNGLGYSDFGWLEEELFRTKRGAYFLAGAGGAMTGYAESCGNNSYGSGEGITPRSMTEARQWLEDHDGSDVLETRFEEFGVESA